VDGTDVCSGARERVRSLPPWPMGWTLCRLAAEAGVLVSCGGNGDCTLWDVRNWTIRATLQGEPTAEQDMGSTTDSSFNVSLRRLS
jgi:hypothetical protein